MILHKSITLAKVAKAMRDEMFGLGSLGFCIACGHEQDGCEPDAREYKCESCGEYEVYGAAELAMGWGVI